MIGPGFIYCKINIRVLTNPNISGRLEQATIPKVVFGSDEFDFFVKVGVGGIDEIVVFLNDYCRWDFQEQGFLFCVPF